MCFIISLPRDRQLLSVRDACLQKNSGLQKRHSRSSLKMDCVVHPVVPGPPLSTWSLRKTDHGESAEIFAASTHSPCLITRFFGKPVRKIRLFETRSTDGLPSNPYSPRRRSQNRSNNPFRPVRIFGHDVRPLQ